MRQLSIVFADHGVTFECLPAVMDLNPIYRAAVEGILRPQIFRSFVGAIGEQKSLELMARVYVEGVIIESEPEMSDAERYDWIIAHPFEFEEMRSYAEHRPNFTGEINGVDPFILSTDEPPSGEDRRGGQQVSGRDLPIGGSGGHHPNAGGHGFGPRKLAVVGGRSDHDQDPTEGA